LPVVSAQQQQMQAMRQTQSGLSCHGL
jgi:hypothetical protein